VLENTGDGKNLGENCGPPSSSILPKLLYRAFHDVLRDFKHL
jgi:hypothetical protein